MNQMGHEQPNLIGVDPSRFDEALERSIPRYAEQGMSMSHMDDSRAPNSLPIVGTCGPFGYITMGGMFTILKVRNELPDDGSDPDWYQSPPGTLAELAPQDDLERDAIELPEDLTKSAAVRTPKKGDAWCGVPPLKSLLQARNNVTAKIKVQ